MYIHIFTCPRAASATARTSGVRAVQPECLCARRAPDRYSVAPHSDTWPVKVKSAYVNKNYRGQGVTPSRARPRHDPCISVYIYIYTRIYIYRVNQIDILLRHVEILGLSRKQASMQFRVNSFCEQKRSAGRQLGGGDDDFDFYVSLRCCSLRVRVSGLFCCRVRVRATCWSFDAKVFGITMYAYKDITMYVYIYIYRFCCAKLRNLACPKGKRVCGCLYTCICMSAYIYIYKCVFTGAFV